MKPTAPLAALALATLVLVGCSSGGSDATTTTSKPTSSDQTTAPAAETTTSAAETTTTEGGGTDEGVPSYEDAKRVYLAQADDATKASCESDPVDEDISVSSGTYTRFTCGGIARFEYIEGAENYAKNWPTISTEEVYRSVLQVPDQRIVAPVGSNDDFAPALASDCGCGEVVEQQG